MTKPINGTGMQMGIFTREILRTVTCSRGNGILFIVKRYVHRFTFLLMFSTNLTTSKELIKVRGFQVAPMEVEAVLLLHPNIVDCAVVGVQHSIHESELPRAYIAVRPGTKLTESEVREFTREKLARYKQLDGGIRFVDKVPRNINGKILKNELRHMVEREIGSRL